MFSQVFKETLLLRVFGWTKIPVLGFCSPSVVELNDEKCVVQVPLNWRTKNHLGSMYFGVLAVGADCAGGLLAMRLIQAQGNKVSLVFKDFKAEFLKRPERAVHFTSTQGLEVAELLKRALDSGERENMTVHIVATVPEVSGDEPVARFELTLSLKRRASAT